MFQCFNVSLFQSSTNQWQCEPQSVPLVECFGCDATARMSQERVVFAYNLLGHEERYGLFMRHKELLQRLGRERKERVAQREAGKRAVDGCRQQQWQVFQVTTPLPFRQGDLSFCRSICSRSGSPRN